MGLDPQTPLGFLVLYLHGPVDIEIMQEGMLHLGQKLAEELEYLLSHARGVLRGQEAGCPSGEAKPAARNAPPPQPTAPSCLLSP